MEPQAGPREGTHTASWWMGYLAEHLRQVLTNDDGVSRRLATEALGRYDAALAAGEVNP